MKELKLKPSLEIMDEVIAFVEQELQSAGVPTSTLLQMDVAVDEIFSNIARHSGATVASVGCSVARGVITLRFADNGSPFDPTSTSDPDTSLSADERQIGGLGIFIVKNTMDSVLYEYADGKNVLALTKTI